MCLVHNQIRDLNLGNLALEKGYPDGLVVHRRMNGQSPYPLRTESFNLVFHQGNQRADYKADAIFCQCRNLEADTLAATSRHKGKGVLILGDAFNHFLLRRTEGFISPILPKYFQEFFHLSGKVNGDTPICGDFQFLACRVNVCGAGDSLFSKEHLCFQPIENFRGCKILDN